MPFIQQFLLSYGAALVIGSIVLTRGPGAITIAVTYGIFGFPFALAAAGVGRLLEQTVLGWSAAIISTSAIMIALYVWAPNKQNAWAALGSIAPFAILFAGIWSFLSWRQAGLAG